MNATLFHDARLAHIDDAIRANRDEAADLVPAVMAGDEDAGKRMNQLNTSWTRLQEARIEAGGGDPAPYRFTR